MFREEAFAGGFVREINDDEPSADGNELGEEAFDDLMWLMGLHGANRHDTYKDPLPSSKTGNAFHLLETECKDGGEAADEDGDEVERSQSKTVSVRFEFGTGNSYLSWTS